VPVLETREHELSSQPPADTSSPLGYQPALDGLRALAVGAVLLYHGGVSWASGGFLGVDVFFVLSGFLITSLLVTEWQRTGGIAILSFYGRRLRRLLPALLLVIAAVLLYAITIAPTSQLHDLRGDILATLGYATNWRWIAGSNGYFDAFALPSPLKHTWSLAVEEQWYLIWPIAVFAMLKVTRERGRRLGLAIGVTAALCALSTIWMISLYTPGADPSRVYYGTDTRAQELLAGALLALVCAHLGRYVVHQRVRPIVVVSGMLGLGWIVWLCADVTDRTTWLYQGGLVIFAFVVCLVVLAAIQPRNAVRAVLSPAWLRWIGAISYGLYLWHWPIYVVLTTRRTGLEGAWLLLARLAITVMLATASYYLVELPVRRGKFSPRLMLVGAPALVLAAVGATIVVTDTPAPLASPLASATRAADGAISDGATTNGVIGPYDPDINPLGPAPADPEALKVAITGDSVAFTLSLGFDQHAGPHGVWLWDRSAIGCPIFAGQLVFDGETLGDIGCDRWRADRPAWLAQFRPDDVVVLSGVWETYDRVVDGKVMQFGTPSFDDWYASKLDATISELASTGAHVVLLSAPCNDRPENVSGPELPENQRDRIAHVNALYRAAVRRHPGSAKLGDLHGMLCPGGEYAQEIDGVDLRWDDGVHLSGDGGRIVSRWLMPKLEALGRS
jgi:peptidoglycan/LPS O-acetylase OafA/YrhL